MKERTPIHDAYAFCRRLGTFVTTARQFAPEGGWKHRVVPRPSVLDVSTILPKQALRHEHIVLGKSYVQKSQDCLDKLHPKFNYLQLRRGPTDG